MSKRRKKKKKTILYFSKFVNLSQYFSEICKVCQINVIKKNNSTYTYRSMMRQDITVTGQPEARRTIITSGSALVFQFVRRIIAGAVAAPPHGVEVGKETGAAPTAAAGSAASARSDSGAAAAAPLASGSTRRGWGSSGRRR